MIKLVTNDSMTKDRRVVNISADQAAEIEALPDSRHQTFAAMVRRLLYEALQARAQRKLEPEAIEFLFDQWGKEKVMLHLANLVQWLSQNVTSEAQEPNAATLLQLFANGEQPNDGDLLVVAHELGIEEEKLWQMRDRLFPKRKKTSNGAT